MCCLHDNEPPHGLRQYVGCEHNVTAVKLLQTFVSPTSPDDRQRSDGHTCAFKFGPTSLSHCPFERADITCSISSQLVWSTEDPVWLHLSVDTVSHSSLHSSLFVRHITRPPCSSQSFGKSPVIDTRARSNKSASGRSPDYLKVVRVA